MKCDICGSKIEELFLGKIQGTYLREKGKSKLRAVCSACQKSQQKASVKEQ